MYCFSVVTDLWHFVSLNHRMNGADEGIQKLTALVDKLIPQLKVGSYFVNGWGRLEGVKRADIQKYLDRNEISPKVKSTGRPRMDVLKCWSEAIMNLQQTRNNRLLISRNSLWTGQIYREKLV